MPHVWTVNHVQVGLSRGRRRKAEPHLLDYRLKIRSGDHHGLVASLLQCQPQTDKGVDIIVTSQRQKENAHNRERFLLVIQIKKSRLGGREAMMRRIVTPWPW